MSKKIPALLILLILFTSCNMIPNLFEHKNATQNKIQRLEEIGLLNNINYDMVDDDNPNAAADLLVESNRMIFIDTLNWTESPTEKYRALFKLLQGINTDVDFELISIEMLVKEYGWYTSEYVLATLEQNGNEYQGAFYYSDNSKISDTYFKVINQFLTDMDSEYRLFTVLFFCRDENCETNYYHKSQPVDTSKFGIISLTREQAETIKRYELLPICCNEFDLLKTNEIKEVIKAFREIGLMDNMTNEEIELSIAEALQSRHDNPESLLHYFDMPFYAFDTETSNFENPYQEIAIDLAQISSGAFQPENFQDKYEYDQPSVFSFDSGGKKYETTLHNDGDWLDLSIVELINNSLEEQGIDGQFYSLEPDGQFAALLFLRQEQFKELTNKNIIKLIEIADSTAIEQGQEYEQHVLDEFESD